MEHCSGKALFLYTLQPQKLIASNYFNCFCEKCWRWKNRNVHSSRHYDAEDEAGKEDEHF